MFLFLLTSSQSLCDGGAGVTVPSTRMGPPRGSGAVASALRRPQLGSPSVPFSGQILHFFVFGGCGVAQDSPVMGGVGGVGGVTLPGHLQPFHRAQPYPDPLSGPFSLRLAGGGWKKPPVCAGSEDPAPSNGQKTSNSYQQPVGGGWRSPPGPAPHCCPPAQVPGLAGAEGLRSPGCLRLGGAPRPPRGSAGADLPRQEVGGGGQGGSAGSPSPSAVLCPPTSPRGGSQLSQCGVTLPVTRWPARLRGGGPVPAAAVTAAGWWQLLSLLSLAACGTSPAAPDRGGGGTRRFWSCWRRSRPRCAGPC